MSVSWFITPYDPKHWEDPDDIGEKPTSDLYVDRARLYDYLAAMWSDTDIHLSPEQPPAYLVRNADKTTLRINLYHQSQIIALNNNATSEFFEFILLYRRFVPSHYDLFFFNSSSWESLPLKNETTREEIRRFMGYQD